MKRSVLIVALVLIVIGVVGLVALNAWQLSASPWDAYGMMGPGMMGNGGMMNGGMMGPGMMGGRGYGRYGAIPRGYGYGTSSTIAPLTLDQAVTRGQTYLASLNNLDLAVAEVMEFSNHFYVQVREKSTGVNAFEILISRNGSVSPEPGPNMMWNAKYSPMASMMGGWRFGGTSEQNRVTAGQAREKAQQYLDAYANGAKVADEANAFYGYYTIDVLRDGKTVGMLSVNGATGAVWYHTWHGTFVSEKEIK